MKKFLFLTFVFGDLISSVYIPPKYNTHINVTTDGDNLYLNFQIECLVDFSPTKILMVKSKKN